MRIRYIKRIIDIVSGKTHKISFSPPSLLLTWINRCNLLLKSDYHKKLPLVGWKLFFLKIKTLVTQSNYQVVELVGIAPASNDDPQ